MSGSVEVHAIDCMCAQIKPRFTLSSERVSGNGVITHVNSEGGIFSTGRLRGGLNLRRVNSIQVCLLRFVFVCRQSETWRSTFLEHLQTLARVLFWGVFVCLFVLFCFFNFRLCPLGFLLYPKYNITRVFMLGDLACTRSENIL